MSVETYSKAELSETTLVALVNLLKLDGYDLDQLLLHYVDHILDNKFSVADASVKLASIDRLKACIDDAKQNPLLETDPSNKK
ncbi:hypothetical protein [Acinetobacter zhairhuonensis]|jgi:hypothetical protein|uniref:hypothetical protein n=1 Tax=Acinetobacter sp. A7.4 TaxID=2919921 RepID=UPI001F4E06D2|nr:hypothetical protein [Acinetobacter sp. A7.4]MCJ8160221.1 hypothetical protein [Acinetobacter sp. A7.4]